LVDEDQRLLIERQLGDFITDAERLLGEARRAREFFGQGDLSGILGMVSISQSTIGQLQKVHDTLFRFFEASGIEPRI
jgi:hypothetical protein